MGFIARLTGKIASIYKPTKEWMQKYSPELLTGATCAGAVGIGVSASLDTKEHLRLEAERPENRRRMEVILDTAWDYRRTLVVTGLTVGAAVASNRVSAGRLAALATALAAAQKDNLELRAAAEEIVGPDKAEEIQKRAEEKAAEANEGPIYRWKEEISGDEFYAPESTVLRAFLNMERRYQMRNASTLNEFRRDVNLGPLDHCIDYVWDSESQTKYGAGWIGAWWSHDIDERGEYRCIHFQSDPEKVVT